MNDKLRASADTIYEKVRLQSGQTLRDERAKFVQTMAARRMTSSLPLSGPELQAVAQIYARHVERCVRARFDSYREAYESVRAVPTDDELREILNGVKDAQEQETRHAATTLQQFALTHGMSTGRGTNIDPAAVLGAASTGVHDQVVQDWKVWRADIALKAHVLQQRQEKRQPASKTSWKSILWSVIAGMALLMLGLAGNSIYAGDVVATFVLCFLGLFLLTARFITWDQTRNLQFRNGANAGVIVLAVLALLLALNVAEKRASPPLQPPLITMQISPSSLPISTPAHSITSVLQLHPYIGLTGDQDGLLKIANDTGSEECWPTKEELATTEPNRHEDIYRVEISNHSDRTLENGTVKFGLKYNAGMKGSGCMPPPGSLPDQTDVVLVPPLDPGKSFAFYAINQSTSCAWLIPPGSATVKMAGQEKETEVPLTFDKNPLYGAGAPVFSATSIKWAGVPTHPGGYGVIRTGSYPCETTPSAASAPPKAQSTP